MTVAQCVGMMLDCGSGHSSIIWYSENNGSIRQLRRSKLRLPEGGNYKITDVFERTVPITESADAFAAALRAEAGDGLAALEAHLPNAVVRAVAHK